MGPDDCATFHQPETSTTGINSWWANETVSQLSYTTVNAIENDGSPIIVLYSEFVMLLLFLVECDSCILKKTKYAVALDPRSEKKKIRKKEKRLKKKVKRRKKWRKKEKKRMKEKRKKKKEEKNKKMKKKKEEKKI